MTGLRARGLELTRVPLALLSGVDVDARPGVPPSPSSGRAAPASRHCCPSSPACCAPTPGRSPSTEPRWTGCRGCGAASPVVLQGSGLVGLLTAAENAGPDVLRLADGPALPRA